MGGRQAHMAQVSASQSRRREAGRMVRITSTSAVWQASQRRLTCEVLDEQQRNLLAQRPDGIPDVGIELLPFSPLLALLDCIRRIVKLDCELRYCLLCDAPMPCEAWAQPWRIAAVCDEQSLQQLPR